MITSTLRFMKNTASNTSTAKKTCEGELWYRGYKINVLIENLGNELG